MAHFDRTRLSKDGYLVKVEEQDVKLPCTLFRCFFLGAKADIVCACVAGAIVLDGTDFRNGAHLRFKADLFVPCGGRYVIIQCVFKSSF